MSSSCPLKLVASVRRSSSANGHNKEKYTKRAQEIAEAEAAAHRETHSCNCQPKIIGKWYVKKSAADISQQRQGKLKGISEALRKLGAEDRAIFTFNRNNGFTTNSWGFVGFFSPHQERKLSKRLQRLRRAHRDSNDCTCRPAILGVLHVKKSLKNLSVRIPNKLKKIEELLRKAKISGKCHLHNESDRWLYDEARLVCGVSDLGFEDVLWQTAEDHRKVRGQSAADWRSPGKSA